MAKATVAYIGHHHVALLALFLALGGTTYAAASLPRNSVGTKQIKNGAVTKPKIAKKTIAALRGARGAQGVPGVPGPPGPPGPTDLSKFGRVAYSGFTWKILSSSQVDVSQPLTITPGGSGYIVLSANPLANIHSMTGCPCTAAFHIEATSGTTGTSLNSFTTISGTGASPGPLQGYGYGSVPILWVKPMTTATPVTFVVRGWIAAGSGTMQGRSELSAVYVPFGSTGT